MSSIRPLATITVLALVGVFLYLKINETEPQLPEGVDDWSIGATDLDINMGGGPLDAGPQFSMEDPTGAPPAFEPAPTTTAAAPAFEPAAQAAPSMSAPPAFEPELPAAAAPDMPVESRYAAAASEPTTNSVPDLPDLPPLPDMPTAPMMEAPQEASVTPAIVAETTLPDMPSESPAAELDMPTAEPELPPMTSAPVTSAPVTPTQPELPPVTPTADAAQAQSSLFSATRLRVQSALDRGELSQALLQLSDWYGDPSLSAEETTEVNGLLSQLAGSVIYSTESRLEPPYMVQAGERLETIAKKYDVPWQLLAKINGITSADQLQPGQSLKVVRGPFSAIIDLSDRQMTLMLDRRYAGKFSLDVEPSVTVEEGHWEVNQKLLTPASASLPGAMGGAPSEERSMVLTSAGGEAAQVVILRGSQASTAMADPVGRVLRLQPADAQDVFDILSLGSKVVIRR